jgi:hypothetical protein
VIAIPKTDVLSASKQSNATNYVMEARSDIWYAGQFSVI